MAEYIRGDVGQTIHQDHGEFFKCGDLRMRKSLVTMYSLAIAPPDAAKELKPFGINFRVDGAWATASFDTKEEAIAELERIDWMFKKEQA